MSKLWHLLAALCMTTLTFVVVASAAEPPKVDPKKDEQEAKSKIDDQSTETDRLKRQFEEIKQSLLRLSQRLESSSKPEDKLKAQTINDAIKKASEMAVDSQFSGLIKTLKGSDAFKDLDQLKDASDRNEALQKDLRTLIELLLRDDSDKAKRRGDRTPAGHDRADQ